MTLGFACTIAALAGYWAMTLSPVEGAVITLRGVRGLLVGQSSYVFGGLVTGPLFGGLGYRWRARRDWKSALAVALAAGCEPLAHAEVGTPVSVRGVWTAEAASGMLMVLHVVVEARRRTRSGPHGA